MLPPPEPPQPPCEDCGYLACICAPTETEGMIDWSATESGPPPTMGAGAAFVDWVERRATELCAHGTHPVPCHLHVRQATLQAELARTGLAGWMRT